MANPTPTAVHIDAALTNLAIGMFQDTAGFVWDKIAPIVPVDKQSNKYWVFDNEYFMRNDMQLRPPATESAGTQFKVSTDSYFADVFAVHYDLDYQTAANADFEMESKIVRLLTHQTHQRLDQDVITQLLTTSIWTTDQTGVSGVPSTNQFKQWNDSASTPDKDVRIQGDNIKLRSGKRPNVFACGAQTYTQLATNQTLLARYQYVQGGYLDNAQIANALGVERVVVADAIKVTNAAGQAKATSFNLGKVAWLGYVEPSPSMEAASAAYIFNWTGLENSTLSSAGPQIARIENPLTRTVRYEAQIAYGIKKVSADLGVFFTSAVA